MNKNINTNAKENIKEKQSLKAKRALTLAVLLSLGATGWTQAASIVLNGDSGTVTVDSGTGGNVKFQGGTTTNDANTKNISVAAGSNTLTFTLKPTLTGMQSIQFSNYSGTGLSYNSSWVSKTSTGLTYNGKLVTPYYGVNSDAGGDNYYGQGATGSNAIAIGIGASSQSDGAIAIGQNASAANKHSIAIGWNAKTVGSSKPHGIAIGGAENPAEAAVAARSSIAMGYNVRLDTAAHSFGFGINLHMGGYRNIAISAAGSSSSPTTVYGNGNTVIGSDNKLDGQSYTKVNDYEYDYKDIVSNAVLGEGNKIVGTSGADATPSGYSGTTGAYRNAIVGMSNTLNGNNYFNMLLASGATLATGAHHNTLLGGTITVGTNVNNSFVLGSNATLSDGSHHNTLLGSGNIVNANIHGSYVLGNNVTVAANNSVYFGDSSTAYTTGILRTPNGSSPTTITGTTTAAEIEKYGLTIGEEGQTTAVIGGRSYNFAGLGQVNGGVISVGKVQLIPAANGVPAHYESVGRIIQNVAPGLIGASSTDAVNGSQLYAVTRAIDLSIARVTSGESGPVVYTTESGERLYKEGSTFYKTTVTTVTDTSTNTTTTYQQATNGFWYPTTSFTNGILKAGVGISEGKTLAQLAMLPQDRTSEVEVKPSNLVLSAVNAQKDSSSSTADQAATTTLTTLKNLKNALTVLATGELNNAAIALYKDQTPGATETTWNDLSPDVKKTWLEKATINNAKAKLAELLSKTNTSDADVQRALSQAVTLQDLQTLAQAGLDFAGDSGTAVHRKLSETLTIKGGETAAANLTTLADKNIGVVADGDGTLNVLLAKNLTSLTSVQTVNNKDWQKQPGDNATLTSTSSVTKLDQYGLHLGQAGTTNTEKASVMLLNPENSLKANPKDNLINNISPIFATASNGAWGTGGSSISGGAQNNGANDGYIFGNGALGLLVGSLAEGASTTFTGSTGKGYAVFLGLRNGVVDVSKTPDGNGQPIIYDLSHAGTDNKKLLPGKASATFESNGPIAIGAYNSITGNSGLAVGSLNRVYGNGGVVVGTTSVADAYSSVGRFGVTMGFNVKNGEWSQQSVAIGANLQAVGSGNIILGGGTDKYYGASNWQGADGQVETTTNGVYTTLGNVFKGNLSNAGMRFFGDRNIVLGAKNRTEGFNPNVGGAGYGGNAGNGSYTRIADNAITGANNSIRDLSFRNSVYGSDNVVTAGADNMIIGSGNKIQAAYKNNLSYTYTNANGETQTGYVNGSATSTGSPILVEGAQTLGNLWRVSTTGSGDKIKADPNTLLYGSSNAVIGARNTISYNTTSNFVAGSNNMVYENSQYNFLAGSRNIAGSDLTNLDAVKEVAQKQGVSISNSDTVDTLLRKIREAQITTSENSTDLNMLSGSYNIAGKGSSGNMVFGNNTTIQNNVTGSYVLGSHVNVNQSNSVYIGDKSVATLTPTAVTDVDSTTGKTKSNDFYTSDTKFEKLSLKELNTLITAGEMGQQAITINEKQYNFAGLGTKGGGVISVGGIRVVDGKNVSYGRIIQNVAPGLIGVNSTDAVNGSQLFAIYNAIDATVKQVVSGDRGPVVYTSADGGQLLRENNTLYNPTVANGYKRAIDGLWYKVEDFNPQTGALKDGTNIFGRTLADINTNGRYYKVGELWYTQDQLKEQKEKGAFVPKDNVQGITQEQFDALPKHSYTVNPEDVILSLVNAERQANTSTEAEATTARTVLANLKEALPILDTTKLEEQAQALYSAGATKDWTLLSPEEQKPYLAQAASNQAKTAITDLLAKPDWNGEVANHELSKAATLQDIKTAAMAGLNFAGDVGDLVHRNLSETLKLSGGVTDTAKLTDNNIGVVANGTDTLTIKLAKDVTGLNSTNYGTVTTTEASTSSTSPFTGFTKYMASAVNPKSENEQNVPLYVGSERSLYTASVDNTGLHLGSGTTEKATVTLINPQNNLNPDSAVDGLSLIFSTANNGGSHLMPSDETNPAMTEAVKSAYDGKIFGNKPLGLLVGTMAEGSSSTMTGTTGNGFGVFVGFNNGVVPITTTKDGRVVSFEQPTIFNNVYATRSEVGNVQGSGGSSAVVFGAFNSIGGNGGLAVGTLNRVYGNEGIAIGNTTIANSYNSVGRFGVTMGFNVKAGEWSQQSVVIGSNMQSVGQGNIVLGGGENKFYGAGSGWNDTTDTKGVYTNLTNTFDATAENLKTSGMRFWGDRNIVIGTKNRTEGFNTSFNTGDTSSGYSGSTGNGSYSRIADNAVVGTNNTLYDLSKMNTVYGSNNVIASGTNNMVIGSDNKVQAQLTATTVNGGTPVVITGQTTGRTPAETAAIAALGNVSVDSATGKPVNLTYGDNNTILGSRNTVGYNTGHNFLAGADNIVEANSMYNFLAGSKNISGVNLSDSAAVRKAVTSLFGADNNISVAGTDDAVAIANDLRLVQQFQLSTLLDKYNAQTGMNLLAGSFNIAGTGTSNNVVEGSNVILRNNVKSTYVLGSHIDADQSNSVYIGDYSVATTTPLSTTKGAYTGNLSDLQKNGTDAVTDPQTGTVTPAVIGLNDLMTAGSTGQTSININGKTYNFAGVGRTADALERSITNEVGTITVGRIVQETGKDGKVYNKSYGRVIQNVAPGLVGANSTDAINGSQLYAIWDAMENSVARVVTGLDGTVVYTSEEGHRLYSWNNTLYDSALVDGKFRQAANGQWYPISAFDTQNGNQLKSDFSAYNGFTLSEINQAKMRGVTLTVTGKDGATATSTAWLKTGTTDPDTTSQVVASDSAVLSLVNGSQSTTNKIALYNVADALSLPNASTTTQSQQQVAVSNLLLGQDESGNALSAYDFSQATNLKDLQNLALAGLDFTGDTLPKDAANNDKVTVHRNLSEALTITGGVTKVDKLSTADNIGVVASNNDGSLTLRLAKELTGLTSTKYTTTNGDTTTITSSGVTIHGATVEGSTAPNPISITTDGINAGNTTITNVKSALASNSTTVDNTNNSYGANLGDVQKLVNAAAWDIGQTTTTTTTPADGGTATTTSTYTSAGTVNNAERVSFDAGTGVKVDITKTDATSGNTPTPETFNVKFAVKTAALERNGTTGEVTITNGGDAGGYATAENVMNIFNSLNTNVSAAKFGLADSTGTGKVEKLLNNTIQITGFDGNISTVAAKSSDQVATNDVLQIKLSPTVTLGDTASTGASGKLIVKNAGQADQSKAVTLSDGAITFTTVSSGTKADYTLGVKADGTKLPSSSTTSPRLTFNNNELATLADGISYQGDIKFAEGGANPFTTALGGQLKILGGVPVSITANDLTTGNIAVVSNGTNTLNLQLRKDLSNMNSITFGGTTAPYVKMELGTTAVTNLGTAEAPNNVTTSVLHFSGLTSNVDTTRINGIFSDKITKNDGIQFATKGDSDVVTVKELKEVATANTQTITTTVKNLYYGFTTVNSGENNNDIVKNRAVNIINTSEDGALPKPDNFLKILGDDSITVDLLGTPAETDTAKVSTDGTALQFSLKKDLVLGKKGTNTGGSITVNGDTEGASIKLDGTSHTLTINSPAEGTNPSSEFTLDGRKGKLVFGGDQSKATIIDFSNAASEASLLTDSTTGDPIAIKRITVGTATNNAPVATMQDGLKFTGNNNDTVARFLNSTLEIKGGATVTGTGRDGAVQTDDINKATTAKNTYVAVEEYDTGKTDENTGAAIKDKRMVIRLAKDMTDLNTITLGGQALDGGSTASTVKLSTTAAVTVGTGAQQKTYSALRLDSDNPVLLRNLAEGVEGSDAATVSQLKGAAWTIGTVSATDTNPNPSTSVNGGDTVNFANGTGTTANVAVATASDVDTYTVKFNIDKGRITSNKTTGAAETTDGDDKFVDSNTIVNAINNAMSHTNQKYTADNKTTGDNPTNVTITRKSGETLGLIGGATGSLTDNNIGTVADKEKNTIAIKLAKKLTGLESTSYTTTESGNTYTTTINSKGISVVPAGVTETDKAAKTITLTENGLYNGNKNITGVTSPLMGLSTGADATHIHKSYGGLSPEFLSTLRDLGVAGNKNDEQKAKEQVKLASAATVGDLQNLSNMPIYFSADNYQDTLDTAVAKKLGEQLSIETGQFNMTLKAGTTDTYDISTYDANSADAYNDENMAAVVRDGGIRLGFRNTPIFTGVRIGTITTKDGITKEHSISIANTTDYIKTDAIPTLKIGGDKAVQITNIATPTENSAGDVAVNKTYVDAAKTSLKGTGAAVVTSTSDSNGTHYNVHVDEWLTYFDGAGNQLTDVQKGADDKYYKASDLVGKKYDATAEIWTKKDGTTLESQPTPITSAVAKLTTFGAVTPVLSNVAKGQIDNSSVDAINGSQLKQLVDKLGLSVNESKTEITGTFNSVNAGGTNTAPDSVVNAINQLTTAVNKGRVYAGDDYVAASGTGTTEKNALKRELGERINITGGFDKDKLTNGLSDGNIGVVHSGNDTLVIKLAKELKGLTSAIYTDDAGNTTEINGGGVTIKHPTSTGGQKPSVISITKDGIDAGNTRVINVAAPNDKGDATNKQYVDDLAKAATTEVTGNGAAIVTSATSTQDGHKIYNVHVDNIFSYKAGDATLVNYGGKYYNAKDVERLTYDNNGKWLGSDGKEKTVTPIDNSKINTVTLNSPSKQPLSLNNIKDNLDTEVSNDTITEKAFELFKETTGQPTLTLESFKNISDTNPTKEKAVAEATEQLQKAAMNTAVHDLLDTKEGLSNAVTLHDLQNVAKAGLNFAGNDDVIVNRPLSSTLTIKGEGVDAKTSNGFSGASGNINLKKDPDNAGGLLIQLNQKLVNIQSISSAVTDSETKQAATITLKEGAKVERDKDGKVTNAKDVSTVSVNNSRITDVVDAVDDSDAVNYKQLKEIQKTADSAVQDFTVGTDSTGKAEGINISQNNKRFDIVGANGISTSISGNVMTINLAQATLKRNDNGSVVIDGDDNNQTKAKGNYYATAGNVADMINTASAAATTKVTGSGAAVVTATTNSDKSVTYNVHVDQTMAYVDKEGNKLIKGSDGKFYREGALDGLHYVAGKDGKDGKWVDKDGKDATKPPTAVDSKDFGGIALVDENGNVKTGDGTSDTSNDTSNGITIFNVTNALADKGTGNGSTSTEKDQKNNDKGTNKFLKTLQGDTLTAMEKASAATVGDLKKLADSPLFFSGDNTDTASIAKKLGSELSITSGAFTVNESGNFTSTTRNNVVAGSYSNRNIAVMNTGTGLVVGMLDTPTFNNVSVKDTDGATVTLEKVTGKPGKDGEATPPAVQFGSKDTKGNTVPVQIKNVAGPVDGTDAVNKAYVVTTLKDTLDKTINPSIQKATTEVTGSGAAVVTKSEDGKDHHTIYNVHVDQTTALVDSTTGEKLTTFDGGKTYYKASDIVNGKPKDGADKIAAKDVTDVSMVKPDGTPGGMVIRNVASAVGTDADGKPNSITELDPTKEADKKILDSAANVGDVKNAVEKVNKNIAEINTKVTNQIDKNTAAIKGGFQVGGDMSTDDSKRRFQRTVGENQAFDIVGGVTDKDALTDNNDRNIGVVADVENNRLNIKLAKKLTGLTSVSSQEFVSETTNDDGVTTKTTIAGGNINVTTPGENGITTTTTITGGNVSVSANRNGKPISTVQLTADGLDMGNNRITNVAPGVSPSDVATVGQLNSVQTLVKKVQKDSAVGDSLNAALAALKPMQYDPLEPTQIMAGTGYYRGQSAVALGVAHYQNESLMYNIGAAYGNSSHMMFNAGVTWKFGSSKREQQVANEYRQGPISSSYVMEDQMQTLKAENQKLREDMAKQDERLKKQEELLQQALRQLQQLTQQQQDSQKPN